jgi:polar amino acid transport system substrate-binding protein
MLLGCSTSTEDAYVLIESRGYFVVGLDDTFAPMGFRNDDDELVGFDIDLAREVALRLGLEVRFQPIDWDAKILELDAGNIDVIWNGLTITPARMEEIAFSNPYLANRQIVIVRAESGIDTLEDLSGAKVGVQVASAAEEAVLASASASGFDELLRYDDYATARLELDAGLIDAIVIDEVMGRYMIAAVTNDYRVLTEDFGSEEYGIGFRKSDVTFVTKVNEALEALAADGTAASIAVRWFGADVFLPQE